MDKALRAAFTPARTEARIGRAIEADLNKTTTVASIERSRKQMARGKGRNWRDLYLPKN